MHAWRSLHQDKGDVWIKHWYIWLLNFEESHSRQWLLLCQAGPMTNISVFWECKSRKLCDIQDFTADIQAPRSSAFTGTYSRVSSALSVHHRHQSCYKCRLFILKGFHFPSLSKSRRKCISSEVPISHLPCYPRIGSQAWESVTNLKMSDEAAPKCFTSNTFSFSFSKAKKEMHHFRIDSRHQRDLKLLWSG